MGCRGFAVLCLSIGLLLASGCGLRAAAVPTSSGLETAASSPCLTYWEQHNPSREPMKVADADLNADGRPDLLVIYGESDGACWTEAALSLESDLSSPIPQSKSRIATP